MSPPVRRRISSGVTLGLLLKQYAAAAFAVLLFGYALHYIMFVEKSLLAFAFWVLGFVILGFPFVKSAALLSYDYFVYRQVYLGLQGEIPRLGGVLTAVFPLPAGVQEAEHVTAVLALSQTRWVKTGPGGRVGGDDQVRSTEPYWSEKGVFPVIRGDSGAYAEIRINIPTGLRSSLDEPAPTEAWQWLVIVEAKTPRSSFSRAFPLEVLPQA